MPSMEMVLVAVIAAAIAIGVVKFIDHLRQSDAKRRAAEIMTQAERDITARQREAELEIKEKTIQARSEAEAEFSKTREELHERERVLQRRHDATEQYEERVRKQEKMAESTQRKLSEQITENKRRQEELDRLLEMQRQTLHELSGLSHEEATTRLLSMLETELSHEAGNIILKHEKKMAEVCEAKSRDILITTIQRYAAAHTAETTTSTVDIPNDEMKGRIIGREGRNIRSFEKATGVDVIIDDTPGVVIVSSFDMVRREVARLALAKLIADGRIHPSRIEEVVGQTQKELEAHLQKVGEEAAQEADVQGLNPKVIALMGRLSLRTSYSQNVLRHSIEVAFLTGMLAEELGLDGDLARRAGLLHDIGKAADHEAEGGHPKIGADLLKRFGEGPEVVPCRAGPSRRSPHRVPLYHVGSGGRCLQCFATGCPSRDARSLHQADGRTRVHCHRLPWRDAGLCDSGGTRSSCPGQCQRHRRFLRSQGLSRHCQSVRDAIDLPRRDQGHRTSRIPFHRNGSLIAIHPRLSESGLLCVFC